MRELEINDFFASGGRPTVAWFTTSTCREVKAPGESEYDYDFLRLVTTIPAKRPSSRWKAPPATCSTTIDAFSVPGFGRASNLSHR
ncbi:hypothetical protein DSL92_02665 [Billgrantia gudaonensis]|uniref:Uncharacterized protein n=1 Tax=Billgrantia gudaonensis TaxID=376427 RepID=A0A3S0NHM1_9GAMM|nr:hypothetical protein DSL92_02665 [Halomonas gudaonensis]